MDVLDEVLDSKLIAILRGVNPKYVLDVVDALNAGGISTIEITLNSHEALSLIDKVSKKMPRVIIGAGTVINDQDVRNAADAGARFIISPIVNKGVIKLTKALGLVSIPGAFTPTEIFHAHELGADLVKVFPASIGPSYFKDLAGPFDQIKLMATGGITLQNIGSFICVGVSAFGIGGGLIDANIVVNNNYLDSLHQRAKSFVSSVKNIRADSISNLK